MLSNEQSERLEALQRKALRIIYGFDKSYDELLTITGTCKLKERREATALSFANKLASSERFRHLFPLNQAGGMSTRRRKKYYEENSRTTRLYNSPLFYLRRLLSQQEDYEDEDEDDDLIELFNEHYT